MNINHSIITTVFVCVFGTLGDFGKNVDTRTEKSTTAVPSVYLIRKDAPGPDRFILLDSGTGANDRVLL